MIAAAFRRRYLAVYNTAFGRVSAIRAGGDVGAFQAG